MDFRIYKKNTLFKCVLFILNFGKLRWGKFNKRKRASLVQVKIVYMIFNKDFTDYFNFYLSKVNLLFDF